MKGMSILIIDDEESICFAFRRYFESRGAKVDVCSTGGAGLAAYEVKRHDLVFLDVRLGDANGLDVLERIREIEPSAKVVIMTAYGDLQTVARAMRNRAFEYLVKPIDLDVAEGLARQVQANAASAREARMATGVRGSGRSSDGSGSNGAGAQSRPSATAIVGSSAVMQEVYKRIAKVAASDAAVLVRGQTGTGKELVARAVHEHSGRRGRAFVPVNCAALPEHLVESELFGYVKGAFTGADGDKPGRFELADGGTLFLDEVGELPPATQVKLLRFLDDKVIERLGGSKPIGLDVRIIAATNRDLQAAVADGSLRADLYFRLAVVQIELPPLSARAGDIVPLARHFLSMWTSVGDGPAAIAPEAARMLEAYAWPGNVRELRNAMEHAVVVSGGGAVLAAHLPETVRQGSAPLPDKDLRRAADQYLQAIRVSGGNLYEQAIVPLERAIIMRALEQCGGNQSAAADLLGLHRNTLRNKVKVYGLDSRDANA